ncbi:MAG: MFS transporter [Gemmataceae bacterium]
MTPPPPPRPSRARFTVLALLCALTFVLYLDRVCISQALTSIQKELKLNDLQGAYVLMSFQLAYGLFEVPAGHWGDRIGSRAVLTRIAVCWSFFTALTGACTGLYSLLAVRFLFGVGEAGALPNVARVVQQWFPAREQGRITGLVQTFMVLGGAVSPLVAAYIIDRMGWRWAFVLFGLTGVVWAAVFWWWFRDDPATHPAVNPAELDQIGRPGPGGHTHAEGIPWRAVLGNPSIGLLAAIMVCGAFNSYVYLSWFSTYLQKARAVDQVEAGQLSSMVLVGSAVGIFLGGFAADAFRWLGCDARVARRCLGAVAYCLAAGLLALGLRCESPRWMAVFAAFSVMAATSTLSTWWACVAEISGRHLGAIFGLVNGLGLFGAMGSQFFFGAFAQWRGDAGFTGRDQWDPAYLISITVLLTAAACWAVFISRPVEADRATGHP